MNTPTVKSGKLFTFVTSGSRGWAKYYSESGPAFLRVGNLDHDSISLDLRDIQRVTPPLGAEGSRTRVKPSDILISITADVGMVGIVPPEFEEAYINQHVALARPTDNVYPAYLAWCLASPLAQRQFRDLQRGATKVGLGLDDIRAVNIPLPSIQDQQGIVAEIEKQFTRLEEGVTALRQVQAKLKRYRAAVLKAACEGHLVPTEAELARQEGRTYEPAFKLLARILAERRKRWAGRGKYQEPAMPATEQLSALPEGWTWISPEQLSSATAYSLAIGPFGSNLKVSDYTIAGVPLIFVRNIRASSFGAQGAVYVSETKSNELIAHQVSGGDVLITKMGDPPGDCCLYPEDAPLAVITADCIKLRLSPLLPQKRFFVHAINSQVVKPQILNVTKGVAQLKVSLGRFANLAVPLPPLGEQTRIVAEVERRLSVVDGLEVAVATNLQRAIRLRQSILKKAFSSTRS